MWHGGWVGWTNKSLCNSLPSAAGVDAEDAESEPGKEQSVWRVEGEME